MEKNKNGYTLAFNCNSLMLMVIFLTILKVNNIITVGWFWVVAPFILPNVFFFVTLFVLALKDVIKENSK